MQNHDSFMSFDIRPLTLDIRHFRLPPSSFLFPPSPFYPIVPNS